VNSDSYPGGRQFESVPRLSKSRIKNSLLYGAVAIFLFLPESVMAQAANFESKVNSLTDLIVGKILPAVAVFGLVYAAILAAALKSEFLELASKMILKSKVLKYFSSVTS
jgi:type IV secretory pathway VirB2 component (pilin)